MSQAFLTENPPLILDSTCSFRKVWPRYASLRIDVRKATRPDIVCDARFLPFKGGVFDEIYCDPPHLIRKGGWEGIKRWRRLTGRGGSYDMFTRYGVFESKAQFIDFVVRTNSEFNYSLKSDGVLYYKMTHNLNNKNIGVDYVFELMRDFQVVKDVVTPSKSGMGKKSTKVHWLTMKPKNRVSERERKHLTNSHYWQYQYLAQRDGEKCNSCNKTDGELIIDHKDGNRQSNSPQNLRLLCRSCNRLNFVSIHSPKSVREREKTLD